MQRNRKAGYVRESRVSASASGSQARMSILLWSETALARCVCARGRRRAGSPRGSGLEAWQHALEILEDRLYPGDAAERLFALVAGQTATLTMLITGLTSTSIERNQRKRRPSRVACRLLSPNRPKGSEVIARAFDD